MEELKIDHTDPDFKEEDMIAKFKELAENEDLHHWEKRRYSDLVSLLNEHRFWDNEPIMLLRQKRKEGNVRHIQSKDIPD